MGILPAAGGSAAYTRFLSRNGTGDEGEEGDETGTVDTGAEIGPGAA
jgi:hypothetical protein